MKMKRIFMGIAFMLSVLTSAVYATVSTPDEVGYCAESSNVYIEGQLDAESAAEPYVTVVLGNGDNVAFIKQINLDGEGKYSIRFKYTGDFSDYTLSVREGERDVNSSVTVRRVESYLPAISIYLESRNNNWYFPSDEELTAKLNIESKYSDSSCSFDIIAAYYDENNALIGCTPYNRSTSGAYTEMMEQPITDVPVGCVCAKVFVWTSISTPIPLSNQDTALFDSYIFGSDKEDVTIAVVGDSLTHHKASYKTALEHFYMTRYPDRKITFVNKGIGGDGADTVIARFDRDVMDCNGKKPDAAILMLGMNDNGYKYYADYSNVGATQWHYNQFVNNYTNLVNMFTENNVPVVLMSSTLYDETQNTALSDTNYSCDEYGANRTGLKNISDYTKALAADKGLPYIPMNELTTSLNEEIRAAHPETGTLFTGVDRIHPTMTGAAFVGFLFAEEQTNNTQVSYVSIDSQERTVEAKNAEISNIDVSDNGISYTYRPKSIPIAATDEYKQIENDFGYDLTAKLNNEIIKISGLAAGDYSITFDGEYILGTYTAEELSNGINIAVNENNPSQLAAKEAYQLLLLKDEKSDSDRSLVRYRAKMLRNGIDIQDDSAVREYLSEADYSIYINLLNSEASRTESINSLREQAREVCVPQTYSVLIQRQG